MSMWAGNFGLATSFIILAAIFLWFFIKSKGNVLAKFFIIPIVIWYGFVVYYTPDKLMGFPQPGAPPNGSVIISHHIIEPTKTEEGYVYFWVIEPKPTTFRLIKMAHPRKIFMLDKTNIPIAYKLKYTKEVHERLQTASDEASQHYGGVMIFSFNDDGIGFEVLNPIELMTKETE